MNNNKRNNNKNNAIATSVNIDEYLAFILIVRYKLNMQYFTSCNTDKRANTIDSLASKFIENNVTSIQFLVNNYYYTLLVHFNIFALNVVFCLAVC